MVRENVSQVREIILQLDAAKTADFRAKLQRELGSQESDVGKLLAAFLQTDDQNFRGRYDFFYKQLAPRSSSTGYASATCSPSRPSRARATSSR